MIAENERKKKEKWGGGRTIEKTYRVQIDLLLRIQVRTREDRIARLDGIVGPCDTDQNQHH